VCWEGESCRGVQEDGFFFCLSTQNIGIFLSHLLCGKENAGTLIKRATPGGPSGTVWCIVASRGDIVCTSCPVVM
jgi:hypothetical protein